MKGNGGKESRIGEKRSALMKQVSRKRDRSFDLAFHSDC